MNDYVKDIAKIDKLDRFNAIIGILKENDIKYRIQGLRERDSIGNIVVEYNEGEDEKIVVGAHYDNVEGTPGANDNASACSILLNLIIDLKDTNKHIEFVFFDLEEYGGIGSYDYIKRNNTPIKLCINLDMCGIGDSIVLSSDYVNNNDYLDIFNKYDVTIVRKLPPGDGLLFIENRIPTLYVINSCKCDIDWYKNYYKGFNRYYPDSIKTMHTPYDTIDKINYKELEEIKNFIKEIIKNTK